MNNISLAESFALFFAIVFSFYIIYQWLKSLNWSNKDQRLVNYVNGKCEEIIQFKDVMHDAGLFNIGDVCCFKSVFYIVVRDESTGFKKWEVVQYLQTSELTQ